MARKLGKEGTVLLLITLCERGSLVAAEIIERAGSGFDEEALAAVRSSTYRPARRNGKPVPCKAFLPIVFRLKE
jgi:protein TonB